MDPLSVAVGAAIGAATGNFVNKTCDAGTQWLADRFRGHFPAAQAEARNNALDMLNRLAERVQRLEDEGAVSRSSVDSRLRSPQFSTLLETAIVTGAQTSQLDKHEVLAGLVADRLRHDDDTLYALCSQLACEAVGRMTQDQMKALALFCVVGMIRPQTTDPQRLYDLIQGDGAVQWLVEQCQPYAALHLTTTDMLHMEALSCLKWDPLVSRALKDFLGSGHIPVPHDRFIKTEIGRAIDATWNRGLSHGLPTTVGQLVGFYTHGAISGTYVSLAGWGAGDD